MRSVVGSSSLRPVRFFFFSSRRRHTRSKRDWSSDVCSSDLRTSMIEIHPFEQLVAFADCGTLSAAAEQLHISQRALSRSMQPLGDELETKIFDRHKSRLSLNENGELTVKYARNLLLQETSMIQQLRDFDRKKRTISVGFCAPALIPEFVALLSRLYEGMALSTEVTGDPRLPEHLAEGRYQLAILH